MTHARALAVVTLTPLRPQYSRYPPNASAYTACIPGVKPLPCSTSRQLVKMISGAVGKGKPDEETWDGMTQAIPLADQLRKP